jgi:hypothetical protein
MNNRYELVDTPDRVLEDDAKALVIEGRVRESDLLARIAEIDRRRLYVERASPSMFDYAVGILGLSRSEAARRIAVARAAIKHPVLFDHIASGALCLSSASVLAPHADDEDAAELIEASCGLTKRQVQSLVADRRPQPEVPTRIEPLGDERVGVQLTVSTKFVAKLEEAQTLMRHQVPDGDVATVLERGLDILLAKLRKQRLAQVERPRKSKPTGKRTRHIPAAVKRAVVTRDEARCTFVSGEGRRCPERGFVQIHHEHAFARGGAHTVENLRVLCRAHNRLEAEREFGAEQVNRAIENSSRESQNRSREPYRQNERDALSALVNLGFAKRQAQTMVAAAPTEAREDLEQLIRHALRAAPRRR